MILPPLSLYIHIPWCIRKCPYCDFNSHAQPEQLPEQPYIEALLSDLREELKESGDRPIHSIFFGGGTPSLFSPEAIAQILDGVKQQCQLEPQAEITLEANPGTFEEQRFQGFKDAGINRLSIGIQSFQAEQLKALGRVHNPKEAIAAASSARQLFKKLNLDLMHGLPNQTPEQALADLQQAIELQPDHLSWYQLTIEPNTEFHAKPPSLPVDETLWEIQEQGEILLQQAGYQQYEISAYAKPNSQAQHNLNYWQFGDYIGIGAGAHGKISHRDGRIERHWKHRQPKAYLNATDKRSGCEQITPTERPFEFMMNALRLTQGVPSHLFSERTQLPLEQLTPLLNNAINRGLLEPNPQQLRPTQQGRLFLNDLLQLFIEEDS